MAESSVHRGMYIMLTTVNREASFKSVLYWVAAGPVAAGGGGGVGGFGLPKGQRSHFLLQPRFTFKKNWSKEGRICGSSSQISKTVEVQDSKHTLKTSRCFHLMFQRLRATPPHPSLSTPGSQIVATLYSLISSSCLLPPFPFHC